MMNSTLNKIVIFAIGALAGSVVTWKVMQRKCEQTIQEEVEAFKEEYSKMHDNSSTDEECPAPVNFVEHVAELKAKAEEKAKEYDELIEENDYISEKGDLKPMGRPVVVSPDDLDEFDYNIETLIYFADGVLADTWGEIVENVEAIVGYESLTHFGENPDDPDTVYVRNDDTQLYYEITLDESRYADSLNGEE